MKNIFWLSLSISVLSFTGITIFYKCKHETEKREKKAASDKYFHETFKLFEREFLKEKPSESKSDLSKCCDELREQMSEDGYSNAEISIIENRACEEAFLLNTIERGLSKTDSNKK